MPFLIAAFVGGALGAAWLFVLGLPGITRRHPGRTTLRRVLGAAAGGAAGWVAGSAVGFALLPLFSALARQTGATLFLLPFCLGGQVLGHLVGGRLSQLE